ncbi:MAG: extracellular solute-binding protein [Oscillospiraceae bacterium]|nr:extracellular solute-binding protein [Oscillospiraceae bacterium]
MKLVKNALTLLLALLMLLSLAACHGRLASDAGESEGTEIGFEGESPVPERFDESKQIEISFWAKNDTNKTQIAIYQQAIDSFQKLYPNVSVKLRLYTDYGRIYNDVITNIATHTTPNVCISYPDHIATYLTGEDVVLPLDAWFADPAFGLGGSELKFDSPRQDEIVPEFLAECVLEGAHYAIPYMRSTEACYVNKTFVEKLGYELPEVLTWDFVWEVSEKAMEKNPDGSFKINGQQVMIPFIYKSTDNMMIQMLRQRGAGYSTADGKVLLFNDTTKELLYTVAEHAGSRAFSTFKISSYPANFLNAGQCIFAVDSTAGATWMGSDAPLVDIPPDQLVEFETAVLPVPQFDVDHPQMISQGPSLCIFQKDDPQEVLASWLFAQYLLTNDVQIAYAETEGYVPVTSKAQNDPGYRDYLSRIGEDQDEHYDIKIQASELLMANTENTFTTPVFNGSASVRDAAGQLIENVTKAVRRKTTVDEDYMQKLYDEVIALYRLSNVSFEQPAEDETQAPAPQKGAEELGPLPAASVALLTTLAAVWLLIGLFALRGLIKKKQAEKQHNA